MSFKVAVNWFILLIILVHLCTNVACVLDRIELFKTSMDRQEKYRKELVKNGDAEVMADGRWPGDAPRCDGEY